MKHSAGILISFGLAMSASAGTLYFGSQSSTQLFKVDSGGTISPFGTTASVPYGLTVDTSGNVYAIANGAHEVDKFTPAGSSSVYADNASAGVLDGNNLAFDLNGYLYTVQNSGQILKIAPGGALGSTLATVAVSRGITVDASGNVVLAGYQTGLVYKISSGGGVSTFASGLNVPYGVVYDSSQNLFVLEKGSIANTGSIHKYSSSGTDLGTFLSGLDSPFGLTIDENDNLYVANTGQGKILKVTPGGSSSVFATADANSVYSLTYFAAVPETSTWASIVFVSGVGGGTAWRRMRRVQA
jgi:sugar lactone lactonase YvrE